MRLRDLIILIIGGGGRESALYWAIAKSPLVKRIYCTPGNGGIAFEYRRNVADNDIVGIVALAKELGVDLVVIGPEVPLVAGLVDELNKVGIAAFGPCAAAAKLEGSKSFGKAACDAVNAPTADWRWTEDFDDAESIIEQWGSVPVIKADGLYAGKGVIVPDTLEEAIDAAHRMLVKKSFGHAGSRIVIEQRLRGPEASFMFFCDGIGAEPLPEARDSKRLLEGDEGPNTGGMGAYSPLRDVDDVMRSYIRTHVVLPILRYMRERHAAFHGLMYVGAILTEDGPRVLEFNARFGDPETQVAVPRIDSDIVPYLWATREPGGLAKLPPLKISSMAAVATNLAVDGYPGDYEKGFRMTELEGAGQHALLFHAGTKRTDDGVFTNGGRVMTCVGVAASIKAARRASLSAAETVQFEKKIFRKDIAANA
jgi:phosphoribosylamine--glycine ligase